MPSPSTPLASPHAWSDRLIGLRQRFRRAVLGHRRMLAFVLVAVAVLTGMRAMSAPGVDTVPITVASRDLPTGATLSSADLRVVGVTRDGAPAGRIRDPVGRLLAGPMRRGEAITDARLVGPALTAGRSALVTTPLRFPDAGMVSLLHVGDRIDVLAVDPQDGTTSLVARDCPVLALPSGEDSLDAVGSAGTASGGRLVVLGVDATAVTSVSGAAVVHFLTFTFSR